MAFSRRDWFGTVVRSLSRDVGFRVSPNCDLVARSCPSWGHVVYHAFDLTMWHFRSLKESAMAELAKTSPGGLKNIEPPGGDTANGMDEAPCSSNIDAVCLALDRYASGDDVDADKVYRDVEAVISVGLEEEQPQQLNEARYKRMASLLTCVAGER